MSVPESHDVHPMLPRLHPIFSTKPWQWRSRFRLSWSVRASALAFLLVFTEAVIAGQCMHRDTPQERWIDLAPHVQSAFLGTVIDKMIVLDPYKNHEKRVE